MFKTLDSAWKGAVESVLKHGRNVLCRNGGSLEIVGTSIKLLKITYPILRNERRKMSLRYAAGELMWYLSRSDQLDFIKFYAPSYSRFSDNLTTLNGGYGGRIYNGGDDLLNSVIEKLQQEPETRQAVIPLFRPDDATKTTKDCPCTLSLQFMLRGRILHLVVTMRSNDLWLGTPYDIFCFTAIQRYVADSLGVMTGTYTHNVGSLHIYHKDLEKAREAVEAPYVPLGIKGIAKNLIYYTEAEKAWRERGEKVDMEPGFFKEIVRMCRGEYDNC